MNTPRKDIVYLMDEMADHLNKGMVELYIANDGTKMPSHNLSNGMETIEILR